MRLLRAEWYRLFTRRFTQVMVALLIAAFAITIASTFAGSYRPTADDVSRAEQQVESEMHDRELRFEQCHAVEHGELTDVGVPPDCSALDPARYPPPSTADFLPGVFVFEQEIRGLLFFLVAFLALFGFLVGSSFVGAELSSGGMTNLLLWRPQRTRVLAAKLTALLGGVLGLSLVSSVVYIGAFWLIAQNQGVLGEVDASFWRELAPLYVRGVVLVLAASVAGFALATLGRHTAAALGTMAAYAVVWELGARMVMYAVETPRPDQLMLSSYLGAWLEGEIWLHDPLSCRRDTLGVCDGSYVINWQTAAAVLALLTAGVLLAAIADFRRRDLS